MSYELELYIMMNESFAICSRQVSLVDGAFLVLLHLDNSLPKPAFARTTSVGYSFHLLHVVKLGKSTMHMAGRVRKEVGGN